MLRKKMLRDIWKNKSQFITIFLMVLIGVMVYVGIEAYMDGMTNTANTFYKDSNLQDVNVLGTSFTSDDLEKVKETKYVNDAERKLELTVTNSDNEDISYLLSVLESNNISKFYVTEGIKFNNTADGIWVDYYHAEENNLSVGDTISFKYDGYTWNKKILGIVYTPDHIYSIKDASALWPDYSKYGTIFMSYTGLEDYIKEKTISSLEDEMNISISEKQFDKINPDFDYEEYIPYNYIMVDVDNKDNVNNVKNDIEKDVDNAMALINIEDTASYTMYQGEIDEGSAYVGIFSGLFLFIAMLSVITTMTRVVKKQKIQIGTLKALGFSKFKITMHYVSYGFWVSLFGAACGILAGVFFLGQTFLNLEMSFFEIPNGHPVIGISSFVVAILVVLGTCLITFLTCFRELKKKPVDSLRKELPNVKNGSLDLTTKGIFKKLSFSSKWNIRDIIRNKFRTFTGIIGIVGCSALIVCALGMLNSMSYFIHLQFDMLYNFDYKLTLKDDITTKQIEKLTNLYGDNTSETLSIEIKDNDGDRDSNQLFVTDASNYVRFTDDKYNYIKLDNDEGVYVTYKFASTNGYKLGDTVKWHIYGSKTYYESKIVGFYRDPQVQGMACTKDYLESIDVTYKPDVIYTNDDLSDNKTIANVELVQGISELKESISKMLSMMREMIIIICVFAVILGAIIIYNMGVLYYGEKEYQFATLKVLGFKDKNIRKIFTKQNSLICIASIIIGLPAGNYLTSYLFKACLDEEYDFGTHINISTFIIAAIGTYLVSYIVSRLLSRKVKNIDMVSSLKANE